MSLTPDYESDINIHDLEIVNLSLKDIEIYIAQIYKGNIDLLNLAKSSKIAREIFSFTYNTLNNAFNKGYLFDKIDPKKDKLLYERAVKYRNNINQFSGAKTWQEARALSRAVFNADGTKRPFKEYREFATRINVQFNKVWLRTEQDQTFSQAQNARQGLRIEQQKNVFPYIKYQTVGDGRVRDSHAALNGLTFKVGDPEADDISPANGWRCRCQWLQLTESEAKPTSKETIKSKTELIKQDFKKNEIFKGNIAKQDYMFKNTGKDKHDYFKVPKQYNKTYSQNFGFKI